MPLQVSDSASNCNEQLDNAARAIGGSIQKQKVFLAIHHGKREIKSVSAIAKTTQLTNKQVLNAAKALVNKRLITQEKRDGVTAYRKNAFLQVHKAKVLRLAGNPKELAQYPTKRNFAARASRTIVLKTRGAIAVQVTIDDIDTFSKVRNVSNDGPLPQTVSEAAFKKGLQAILGEPGRFTDWGGERNDLLSTRLRLMGKRRNVAFAFKGPGTKGALTPGKMGKNGDQIQRLFQSTADVFLLQYWREIGESVLDQMRPLAMAKSLMDGKQVWYGIIDGVDSNRIYVSYRNKFKSGRTVKRRP
jgi:hypothetical protein